MRNELVSLLLNKLNKRNKLYSKLSFIIISYTFIVLQYIWNKFVCFEMTEDVYLHKSKEFTKYRQMTETNLSKEWSSGI